MLGPAYARAVHSQIPPVLTTPRACPPRQSQNRSYICCQSHRQPKFRRTLIKKLKKLTRSGQHDELDFQIGVSRISSSYSLVTPEVARRDLQGTVLSARADAHYGGYIAPCSAVGSNDALGSSNSSNPTCRSVDKERMNVLATASLCICPPLSPWSVGVSTKLRKCP